MKPAVEELACLDASAMAWTGVLDVSWDLASGEPQPETWAALEKQMSMVRGFHGLAEELSVLAAKVVGGDGVRVVTVTVGVRASLFTRMVGNVLKVKLRLEAERQNFGGQRWWFCCGVCGARRAYLYAGPSVMPEPWRCRECLDATYSSRSRNGQSARHGGGWGSVFYHLDQRLKQTARRARRSYRRQLHRERQRPA